MKYGKIGCLAMIGLAAFGLSGCNGNSGGTGTEKTVTPQEAQNMKAKQEAFYREKFKNRTAPPVAPR